MAWKISFYPDAEKDLARLDRTVQRRITQYLLTRVATAQDPGDLGKPLTGTLAGLWRYDVGDYRIVCRIRHELILVLVLAVGHRKDIYERFL